MTRIAVLISFSGAGGVERMVLNLIDGFATHGVAVDLLAIRAESAHLGTLRLRRCGRHTHGRLRCRLCCRLCSRLAPPAAARWLPPARLLFMADITP